jgi:D-3-phosphoglycerate dehydrogenase
MYRVLLTDNISSEAVTVLEAYPEIEAILTGTMPEADLKIALPDFDAVIVRSPTKLTADVLACGQKLKYIGRAGVGVDNIDIEAAGRQGIVVMNVVSGNTISTAEFTLAMILALVRRIPQADQSVRSGRWDRKSFKGLELHGKTLGIIGLGRVGREVARRAGAFSMRVVAADPALKEAAAREAGAELVSLETVLRDSDIVTIHVPLGPETKGLISEKELKIMKEGAFLVNCARGGVVDEKALENACRSGKLAGTAADVYTEEPPGEGPLLGLPNTVWTPHIGGMTPEAHRRIVREISKNIADALVSGVVRNAVTGFK